MIVTKSRRLNAPIHGLLRRLGALAADLARPRGVALSIWTCHKLDQKGD